MPSTDMIIVTPEVKKTVIEYDFLFASGVMLPITIDESLGDTITFNPDTVEVHLTPKTSIFNPELKSPGEDLTIFKRSLLTIQKRLVEKVDLTPEQRVEWTKTVKELGTVQ